jgi:hypothetical protein
MLKRIPHRAAMGTLKIYLIFGADTLCLLCCKVSFSTFLLIPLPLLSYCYRADIGFKIHLSFAIAYCTVQVFADFAPYSQRQVGFY